MCSFSQVLSVVDSETAHQEMLSTPADVEASPQEKTSQAQGEEGEEALIRSFSTIWPEFNSQLSELPQKCGGKFEGALPGLTDLLVFLECLEKAGNTAWFRPVFDILHPGRIKITEMLIFRVLNMFRFSALSISTGFNTWR